MSDPLKRINIEEIKKHEFYLKGERIYDEIFNKKKDDKKENKKEEENIKQILDKTFKSENDYEKKIMNATTENSEKKINKNNPQNILFLDYLKSEKANKKNNIQHKPPITITLNKGDNKNKELVPLDTFKGMSLLEPFTTPKTPAILTAGNKEKHNFFIQEVF